MSKGKDAKSKKFADAVRILLWGNGDLHHDILTLEKVLAEYDNVEVHPGEANRLTELASYTTVTQYQYLSGDEWNEPEEPNWTCDDDDD